MKTYGNIVSFRDLEEETNDAIALFGNKDARGIVLLKPYGDYYAEYVGEGRRAARRGSRSGTPIVGESAQKEFIALFGAILRLQNILTSFDDFAGNELLTERQSQDYRSVYLDLYAEFRRGRDADKESINDDIVFEIELIKQVEINVDYILMLVQKYREERGDGDDKEIEAAIRIERAVDSSPACVTRRTSSRTSSTPCLRDWRGRRRVARLRCAKRDGELDAIIIEERLRPEETSAFIDHAFRDGAIPITGTAITKILPAVSRFSIDGSHGEKKQRVIARLGQFFERFFGLGGGGEQ